MFMMRNRVTLEQRMRVQYVAELGGSWGTPVVGANPEYIPVRHALIGTAGIYASPSSYTRIRPVTPYHDPVPKVEHRGWSDFQGKGIGQACSPNGREDVGRVRLTRALRPHRCTSPWRWVWQWIKVPEVPLPAVVEVPLVLGFVQAVLECGRLVKDQVAGPNVLRSAGYGAAILEVRPVYIPSTSVLRRVSLIPVVSFPPL
ncbi:hypothetical protein EJ06DRAFT_340698 [Trichodelitschia bisporula]|uniref:Uncharacterized protein n=1 Tax=Trichodelitschia bisporula TaxID=703511 RepID=A0A6G1I2E4_9PEZI|nr:hypothetical protein EJ06DRAFT_340698 [Trichodelitschia bisporula]